MGSEGILPTPSGSTHSPATAPASPAAAAGPNEGSREFARVLHGLGKAIDRGEAIMSRASHEGYASMDVRTLIALQSGIYRYSEAIDLTARLVDRLANGARTVLQSGQ